MEVYAGTERLQLKNYLLPIVACMIPSGGLFMGAAMSVKFLRACTTCKVG